MRKASDCAFLNKKLTSVKPDPDITPASGLSGNGAYVHSSVLCRAGANGCEDTLLGVANLKGTLLNQGAACARTPHADTSSADMWQLDLTPGTPPKAFAAVVCWQYDRRTRQPGAQNTTLNATLES